MPYVDTRPSAYPLRLEPALRAKIDAIAKANGRSVNTEIAIRLEASLKADEQGETVDDLESTIRRIAYEVAMQVVSEALPKKKKPQ